MTAFIESIDIRAMECVRKCYNLSTKADRDGNIILKLWMNNLIEMETEF